MSSIVEAKNSTNLFIFFDTELDSLQEHILLLFSKQPKIIGKTRLQKLIFLMDQEIFDLASFGFEPYKFGPYSSKLLAAMDELMELGLIKETINEYCEPERYVTEYEISSDGLEDDNEKIQLHELAKKLNGGGHAGASGGFCELYEDALLTISKWATTHELTLSTNKLKVTYCYKEADWFN